VAEGAPGRDGVGERDPDAAVHVAAGMEVALVDQEPALHLVVLDPDHLDAEVAREAALDARAEALGCDLRIGQAAFSKRAPPS